MNSEGEYEIGDVFKAIRVTPLMPEFDPEWSLWAIRKIQYLPEDTELEVLLSVKKHGIIWYRVEVLNTLYKGEKGWINSTSLLGNENEQNRN